ncbi:hypothetical protein LH412_06565 [Yersinia intermedia]|uniref:hypothetical protein n=1 Tax=Yersinia intermedia TaxID=631 RepID=UPI001CFC7838|nr:hypothetical protein [Yersinia intermedia]MCB5321697.1 hypothetical protein [Yersinia intermedia]
MNTTTLNKNLIVLGTLLLAFNAQAYNVVGTVKAWSNMKQSGWKSADGFTDEQLGMPLYKANVIENYPWTDHFFIRTGWQGNFFLADKRSKTIKLINAPNDKPADLTVVYQGEDTGKGCYFSIVDSQAGQNLSREYNEQVAPKILTTIADKCINKKQLAEIKAKESSDDRLLKEWVAKETLNELCRKKGNC